jgi:hypothetical protein
MFKKLISVLYVYYSRSPFEDAYSASIFLACAIQQFWLFVVLGFLNKRFDIPLTWLTENIYMMIPISIIWAWIFFKLYTKTKVLKYVEEFKLESKAKKTWWIIMSICLLAIPLSIIFFYF